MVHLLRAPLNLYPEGQGNIHRRPRLKLLLLSRVALFLLAIAIIAPPVIASPQGEIVFVSRRYSPDGDGSDQIYRARPDGTGDVQLTKDKSRKCCPSWSPDKAWLLYVSEGRGLVALKRGGQSEKVIYDRPYYAAGIGAPISWNSSGTAVIFLGTKEREYALLRADLIRGTVKELRTVKRPTIPSWSPDGKAVLFHDDGKIWVMRQDGSGAKPLFQGAVATFSPNGKMIAVADPLREGPGEVRVLSLKGEVLATFSVPSSDRRPTDLDTLTWTGDSRSILAAGFHGSKPDAAGEIFRLDLESKKVQPLAEGFYPAPAPTGRYFAFQEKLTQARLGDRRVWVRHLYLFDLSTGKIKPITSGTSLNGNPHWR